MENDNKEKIMSNWFPLHEALFNWFWLAFKAVAFAGIVGRLAMDAIKFVQAGR